jgi:DNA helicase-2/ATP-dependent DNA helicase PcrA
MGESALGRLGPLFVGTIHAYCLRLLQDHAPQFGNHDVLDEHRHAALLSRHRIHLKLDTLHVRHWESIRLFQAAADTIGNELIPLEALEGHPIDGCYRAYRELLEQHRFLTFGQIVAQAVDVLENDERIRNRVRDPLLHLIVDEYQDINPAQERLIRCLAADPVSLCVVGDDDQAIYQWRGSDVGNILGFVSRYRGAAEHRLETNYRSRPAIVDLANRFAKTIPERLEKEMDPQRPSTGTEIVCWIEPTPIDEANRIADHIALLHEQGWRFRDMAVLFRSVRTSAPLLVAAFTERGIPFQCGGRTGLFSHPEIEAFGELFCWMADFSWKEERFGPGRDADVNSVTQRLAGVFGVAPEDHEDLLGYFTDWKVWHENAGRRVNLIDDYYSHLQRLGVTRLDPDSSIGSSRLGALARFSRLLADYEHVTMRSRWEMDAQGHRTFRQGHDRGKGFWTGLANYLLHYAKAAYEDFEGEEGLDEDAVSILTVHQSKGLEWPVLFLPSLSKLRFPSTMAGRRQEWMLPDEVFPDATRRRYEGSVEDERRLFYVAMTRARDVLYASTFERITNRAAVSPFLSELAGMLGLDPKNLPTPDSLPCPSPPDHEAPVEPKTIELGYSDLARYEDCGFQYRLSKIFGFEQELAQELGYGKAVHHVMRHLGEFALQNQRAPDAGELDGIILRELYVPFANTASFENMHKSVLHLARRYLRQWSEDLTRIWASERPFEIHFEGGILAGRADVILDREQGRPDHLAIVGYKTSVDEGLDDRYERQLQVYAAAGRQEGLQVDACYLHDLKQGDRNSVPVARENTDSAVEWAATCVSQIRTGVYPSRPAREKCKACDMQRICRHAH